MNNGTRTGLHRDYPPRATVHVPPEQPSSWDDEFDGSENMSGPGGLANKWLFRALTPAMLYLGSDQVCGGVSIETTSITGTWGLEQNAPSGDFTIIARLGVEYMSERQIVGVHAIDGSGNGVSVSVDSGDISYLRTLPGLTTLVGNSHNQEFGSGRPLRFVLRKVGGVYYSAVQSDDVLLPSRIRFVSGTPTAFTPAKIGVGRYFGNGITYMTMDYFRVLTP